MRSLRIALALLLLQTAAMAADFSGVFSDAQIRLELKKDGENYAGTLAIKGEAYPASAVEKSGQLDGVFDVKGNKFNFVAVPEGNDLKLSSGGRTYTLARQAGSAPINPITGLPEAPAQNVPNANNNTPNPPPAQAQKTTEQITAALKSLASGQAKPSREWTVLVYMAADNDLEPFGIQDINEMEKGLNDPNVEILVLVDRAKGFDKSEGDWTGAKLYRVVSDMTMNKIASTELLDLGELNIGDPKILAAFIEGGLKAYPARQHALLMWNHGGGWASMSNDFEAPGTDKGDDLKLPELREAIDGGLKGANLKKLQIIGFDMCLMSQLETATELADHAEVMVASQALEPGMGWPYDYVVPAFSKGTAGPRRIGTDIVTAFNDFYKTVKKEEVATLSALDLALTGEFNTKLNALVDKYAPTMDKNWTTLARAIFYGEQYGKRTDYKRGKEALASFDVLDMVKRLKFASETFPAENEYRELMSTADRFILMSANSDRHRLSNGVAVYAPVHAKMIADGYQGTRFSQASKWPSLVARMHTDQAKDTTPPVFSNFATIDSSGQPVAAFKPLAGHRYKFTLTGNNIINTQVWSGSRSEKLGGMIVESKSFVIDPEWILRYKEQVAHAVDLLMPKYKDGVNELKDDFLGVGLIVSNGRQTSTLTIDGTDLEGSATWTTEALLEHPSLGNKPVQAMIVFSHNSFKDIAIVANMPQPDGTTRPRMVEPQPDLKISMIHEIITDAGESKFHTFDSIDYGDGLGLVVVSQKPGDYEAILIAETMGGVIGTARAKFKVEADQDLINAAQGWQFFKPEMLAGSWEAFIRNGEEQKLHMTLTIKQTDKPDMYVAEVTQIDGAKSTMLIYLDLRGLPNLRMIELTPEGKPGSVILAPALFDADKEMRPFLWVKYVNLSGVNAIWKRKEPANFTGGGGGFGGGGGMAGGGGGVGPGNEERLQPVQVPDPIPLQPPNMQPQPQGNGW